LFPAFIVSYYGRAIDEQTIQDKCGTDRRDIRLTKENPETGAIGIRSQKRRKVPEGAWIKISVSL
jgi:hypothetical protein